MSGGYRMEQKLDLRSKLIDGVLASGVLVLLSVLVILLVNPILVLSTVRVCWFIQWCW